jgi:hypothetical protein
MKQMYVNRFQVFLSIMLLVNILLIMKSKTFLELQMGVLLFFGIALISVLTLFIKTK